MVNAVLFFPFKCMQMRKAGECKLVQSRFTSHCYKVCWILYITWRRISSRRLKSHGLTFEFNTNLNTSGLKHCRKVEQNAFNCIYWYISTCWICFECDVISRHCSVEEILCAESLRGFALILFSKTCCEWSESNCTNIVCVYEYNIFCCWLKFSAKTFGKEPQFNHNTS